MLIVPNQLVLSVAIDSKEALLAKGDIPEGFAEGYLDPVLVDPTFVLHSPDDMEPFIRDYSSILKPEVKFYSNHSGYNDIAGPLEQTKKLASYVLYFSVLAAVLIIGLTVLLFMKERKHELGILMSLGE